MWDSAVKEMWTAVEKQSLYSLWFYVIQDEIPIVLCPLA